MSLTPFRIALLFPILIVCSLWGQTDVTGDGVRSIVVDSDGNTDEIRDFWRVANFAFRGTVSFTETDHWQELTEKAPFSREVVVDYLLGGRFSGQVESFIGVTEDGSLNADFTVMLSRVRRALEAGYTPWLGLEKTPPALSETPDWNSYGNTAPVKDIDLWYRYVRAAIEALVDEFGRETVLEWNFFTWTEPDLNPGHWSGTKQKFLRRMDYTVAAVLSVLPEAKIAPGNILNPAFSREVRKKWGADTLKHVTSREHWGLEIIDHAAEGVNYATGETGTRMDYFSASCYGKVGRSNRVFGLAVRAMRERLDRYPQFEGIPIDVREFSVLNDDEGLHLYAGDASEWSASMYASLARMVHDLNVRYVFEWDHATMGVLHPRGHVIEMLDRMVGGRGLPTDIRGGNPELDCGVIAARKGEKFYFLLYNHQAERSPKVAEPVELRVTGAEIKSRQNWELTEWTIDQEHGVWIYAFCKDAEAAGILPREKAGRYEASPWRFYGDEGVELFRKNIQKYRDISELTPDRKNESVVVGENGVSLRLEMAGHSVRLIEIAPSVN